MVTWEDGSVTYEPLYVMATDAIEVYTQDTADHELLNTSG